MRLSSLARKIKIKPSEIGDFFVAKGITLSAGSNTKLTVTQINLVVDHFQVELPEEKEFIANDDVTIVNVANADEPAQQETAVIEPDEEPALVDDEIEIKEPTSPDDDAQPVLAQDSESKNAIEEILGNEEIEVIDEEEIELIKAPKIKLPGLTVKGKIDLPPQRPKPEKKEQETVSESKKAKKHQGRKRFVSDDYNPLEAQRARKARNDKRAKELIDARLKSAKRDRYLEQHGAKSEGAVKRQNKSKRILHEIPDTSPYKINANSHTNQRNLLQRIWYWLNTY